MNRRYVGVAAALVAVACASQKSESAGTGPAEEQQKVSNLVPFDLINCFPSKVDVPKPANEAILAGYWVAAKPRIDECLLDPKNRGPEKTAKVSVTTTVSETGVDRKVAGVNLTPAGQKCIEDAFTALPTIAPLPKGHKPVTFAGELPFTEASPSVVMGRNEISDLAATVRLAEPTMCGCFEPWKDSAPKLLKAKMLFTRAAGADGGTVAPQVTFLSGNASGSFVLDGGTSGADDALDATSSQVASCLKEKLTALPFAPKSQTVGFTYPFVTLNSRVADVSADAPGNVQVMQLDGVRAQRSAAAAMKLGARANAALGYDDLVKRYKKGGNHPAITFKDLDSKCQAMLHAEDDYKAAVQSQRDVEQKVVTLVSGLKAKEPQWAETEALAQKNLAASDADLQKVTLDRQNDQKACPKQKD